VSEQPAHPAGAPDVEGVLEAVRAAGDGLPDARAALRARQTRAGEADVARALAGFLEGSPSAQRLRAGLRELGVSQKAMEASARWWRAQRAVGGRNDGGGHGGEEDERPVIRVTEEVHRDIERAIAALELDPDLYCRGGALVRVVRGDGGEPSIAPHTVATLRARMTRFAHWVKTDESGETVPCVPPDVVTVGVLEMKEWPGLRPLAGIVETPTLRVDLTVSQRPGYDPATRTLYLPTIDFPAVPESPTQQESADAMRFLWVETSYDFPFRGMGYADAGSLESDPDGVFRYVQAKACADAWGITSAIFSRVARPAIVGNVPAILFDAAGPGSGKGLSADVVALATDGRIPEKLTWPNHGDRGSTDAEVEKRLVGPIVEGAGLIVWDEILGAFGGPSVNNALTCEGKIKVRIITTPSTPTLSYTAVMLGCGNNITARDNTHRRSLIARIESPDEDPDKHTGWRRPNLRASVAELRPRLVVAALTVLRGYAAALDRGEGEVEGVEVWGGGFESWSQLVVRAMVWAGGGNVMGCRPSNDPEARNEEKDQVAVIMDAIARLEPKREDGSPTGEGIAVATVLNALYTPEQMKGQAAPDGFDDAREAIDAITETGSGRKPAGKKLGDKLHLWRRRPVAGKMLETTKKDRNKSQRWTVRGAKR
jgi:hypothetical protein